MDMPELFSVASASNQDIGSTSRLINTNVFGLPSRRWFLARPFNSLILDACSGFVITNKSYCRSTVVCLYCSFDIYSPYLIMVYHGLGGNTNDLFIYSAVRG
jgi:hypothetical protein